MKKLGKMTKNEKKNEEYSIFTKNKIDAPLINLASMLLYRPLGRRQGVARRYSWVLFRGHYPVREYHIFFARLVRNPGMYQLLLLAEYI